MFQSKGHSLVASVAKRLCPSSSKQALSSAAPGGAAVDSPSALYIPGKYCVNTTPTVIPHYDLNDMNIEKMKLNLKARGMESQDTVLQKIAQGGKKIIELSNQLALVSNRKDELVQVKLKGSVAGSCMADVEKEFQECKAAEKDLNRVMTILEEQCILKYLNLPNDLHSDTPSMTSLSEKDDVTKPFHSKGVPKPSMKPHNELCRDDLTFTEHGVYMSGPLARLELSLSSFVQDLVLESDGDLQGFEMVVGTDFTRSVIVEGCHPGSDIVGAGAARVAYPIAGGGDVSDVHGAMGTHLVGSASIYTFVSQLVKQVLFNKEALPKRQICLGRNYKPVGASGKIKSLFEVSQTTALEAFSASRNEQEMESEFEMLVETLKTIYDHLDCHYRMTVAPAHRLDPAQSKRVIVEMAAAAGDSTGNGNLEYVEVANAAIYGDFLSKRLMLLWKDGAASDAPCHDLHIASGTLMNVTKVIGCLVENKGLDFCLSKFDEF